MSRFASPFTVGSQTCWKKSNISQRSALNPLPWLCCKSHLHCQFAGFDPIKGPIGQNIRDKKQYIILLNQNQNIRFYSLLCSFDCQHLFWRRGGSNSNWLNKVWGQHMILWIDCKRCSRQHQLDQPSEPGFANQNIQQQSIVFEFCTMKGGVFNESQELSYHNYYWYRYIRVAELGSLSSGAKMTMKIFVMLIFTTFATNASFLHVMANLQT